jgi:hypothetical protein
MQHMVVGGRITACVVRTDLPPMQLLIACLRLWERQNNDGREQVTAMQDSLLK